MSDYPFARLNAIQAPDACIMAVVRVLAGQDEEGKDRPKEQQNTPGRLFLLALYRDRIQAGEDVPDAIRAMITTDKPQPRSI